jgi:uncharacterized protein
VSKQVDEKIGALNRVLDGMQRVAVAVSGGVDSVTLACAVHRRLGVNATMFHAVSPAVPPEATERTRQHAGRFGWKLEIMDAGEFSDPEYLSNPVDRCFFCKSSLYGTIVRRSSDVIVSGTNLDDLADFRPGLRAAENHRVRHPYVETRIDKAMVRAIARAFDLGDMADLPASPCLSSRIETGIAVDAPTLSLVHAVEKFVGRNLQTKTVRCRVRSSGLVIELDGPAFERVAREQNDLLLEELGRLCAARGFPGTPRFERYAMGSAFLRDQ